VLDARMQGRQFVAVDSLSIADFAIGAVVHMVRTREHADLGPFAMSRPTTSASHRSGAGKAALSDSP